MKNEAIDKDYYVFFVTFARLFCPRAYRHVCMLFQAFYSRYLIAIVNAM